MTVMKTGRLRLHLRGGVCVLLVAGGLGVGASGLATRAAATTPPRQILDVTGLLPGSSASGSIEIPASATTLSPYVETLDLHDGCVPTETCTPDGPVLSRTLLLTFTAPNGRSVSASPAELVGRAIHLPGGLLFAHSRSRTYSVALFLPMTATNSSESRTISFDIRYGGMDAAGDLKTSVLGETFTKTSPATGSTNGSGLGHELPFTGSVTTVQIEAGGLAVIVGSLLFLVGRRRYRRGTAEDPSQPLL